MSFGGLRESVSANSDSSVDSTCRDVIVFVRWPLLHRLSQHQCSSLVLGTWDGSPKVTQHTVCASFQVTVCHQTHHSFHSTSQLLWLSVTSTSSTLLLMNYLPNIWWVQANWKGNCGKKKKTLSALSNEEVIFFRTERVVQVSSFSEVMLFLLMYSASWLPSTRTVVWYKLSST